MRQGNEGRELYETFSSVGKYYGSGSNSRHTATTLTDLAKFNKENREQYELLRKEYQDAYEQMMKAGGMVAQGKMN